MTQMLSRWSPGPDVVDHTGDPIPSEAVFFTPPPVQIGEIYTAHTGWVGNKKAGSGAGSAISVTGWDDLRDYSFVDHAVLCHVRS